MMYCCFLIAVGLMNWHEMSPVWCSSELACHCLRLCYSLIHLFQALIWGLQSAVSKKRLLFTLIHWDNTMAKAQAPWEAVAVCYTHHTHTHIQYLCSPLSHSLLGARHGETILVWKLLVGGNIQQSGRRNEVCLWLCVDAHMHVSLSQYTDVYV